MSGFFQKIQKIDPAGTFFAHRDPVLRNVNQGLGLIRNPNAPPPTPPNQDTAANSAQQQAEMLRRRRGVMANIFGGNNSAPPATAAKTALGS